jgi:hypothetical protein
VESVTEACIEDGGAVIVPVDLDPPQAGPSNPRRSRNVQRRPTERFRAVPVEDENADFDVVMWALVLPEIPLLLRVH